MPHTQGVVVSERISEPRAPLLYSRLQDSLLFVLGEVLYHLPRLLATSTTLENSPDKEPLGPCIFGTPVRRAGARETPERVSQQEVSGSYFQCDLRFILQTVPCYLNPSAFIQMQECALLKN